MGLGVAGFRVEALGLKGPMGLKITRREEMGFL